MLITPSTAVIYHIKSARSPFRECVLFHGLDTDIRPFTEEQALLVAASQCLTNARFYMQLLEDLEIAEDIMWGP